LDAGDEPVAGVTPIAALAAMAWPVLPEYCSQIG
jgi:hypothetical protein